MSTAKEPSAIGLRLFAPGEDIRYMSLSPLKRLLCRRSWTAGARLDIGYLWTVAGWDVYATWVATGIAGAIIMTTLNVIGVNLLPSSKPSRAADPYRRLFRRRAGVGRSPISTRCLPKERPVS